MRQALLVHRRAPHPVWRSRFRRTVFTHHRADSDRTWRGGPFKNDMLDPAL